VSLGLLVLADGCMGKLILGAEASNGSISQEDTLSGPLKFAASSHWT
jgi:hypothetical protein